MNLKVYLTCVGLMVSLCSTAQVTYSLGEDSTYINQIRKEAEAKDDSTLAYTYLKIALLYKRVNDITNARKYLQQGINTSDNNAFLKAAAAYYKTMVEYAGNIASLENDLLHADSLMSQFRYVEAYRVRAMIWNNYGTIQQMKGNEKKAMEVYTNKAASFAFQSKDFLVQAKTNKSIAIVFMNANQREKAVPYLNQSIEALEMIRPGNPIQRVELVETYIIAAENQSYLHRYDSASVFLTKARKILSPYPASNLYLIYYYAEGTYFDQVKRYAEANRSFELGIMLADKLKASLSLNRVKYAKFKTLSNQKEYQRAAAVMEDLLQSPLVFITDKKIYFKELYSTYAKIGNTREAFRWAERYITVSDSLYEHKFQNDIMELEKKYKEVENEKKIAALYSEKEKTLLASRNTRLVNGLLVALSLFLSITIMFSVVLYRNTKKLAAQKEIHYQQQLRETEQNQHIEIAKALMLGEEKERKRLAIDLHDGLGSRLAGVKISLSQLVMSNSAMDHDLLKVIDQLDVSSNELRRIARNLMPEALLQLGLEPVLKDMCDSMSTEKTHVEFQAFGINTSIPQEIQVSIYRIIQELLTNAIRHAQASEILVQCSQNLTIFFITIEDNGKGFDTLEVNQGNGIGLANVKKRVQYLRGKLDITSLLQEGTTINIEFDVTA